MFKQNTLFIGNVVEHYAELDSTNDFAIKRLAKTSPSEGFVISTDYQRSGRGQIGSSWHSQVGVNLLLSIILKPKWLAVQNQFQLSQAISLAIADTVEALSPLEVKVKWPNDIYLNDKKIAGILIQNNLANQHILWSVVGIGLNVNQSTFPDELPNASSLKILTGQTFNRTLLQKALFQNIEYRYLQLKSGTGAIAKDYLQNLYQYQSWSTYQEVNSGLIFEGQIIGVNKMGHLAVQKKEKQASIKYFDLKEIVFL